LTEAADGPGVRLHVARFNHTARLDGQETERGRLVQRVAPGLGALGLGLRLDATGSVTKRTVDAEQVLQADRPAAAQLGERLLLALEAVALPTPGKTAAADERWK